MSAFRILDTYKAYKVREQKFTSWLREKAAKLGYFESRLETQPKNKKNKDRKDGGQSSIRISEIPHLVQLIVSKGEAVPDYLRHVLRDVISQRKEATAFYKPQGRADEGHAHYIEVLEEALMTFESSGSMPPIATVVKTAAPSHRKTDLAFNNVFELLHIEDVNGDAAEAGKGETDTGKESHTTNGSSSKLKPIKKKKNARRPQRAEKLKAAEKPKPNSDFEKLDSILDQGMEFDDDEDDLYFMIYCFFKDFNNLREYIQERWCDYADGSLNLSTVALATNTAFELLQRAEEELISQIPVRTGLRNYEKMANMLFFDVGLAHVDYAEKDAKFKDDEEKMSDTIYEEADWLCLPRYWDLYEWLEHVPPRKITTNADYLHRSVNYQAEHPKEKMARDRQIVYELIAECTLIKPLKNHPNFQIPGEDEFTIGLIEMLASRHIPIWLVFAAQIQCDIRWILEDHNCEGQVLDMGERVQRIVGDYIEFSEDFDAPMNPAIQTTYDEAVCWLADDFMEPQRTELHVRHGEAEEDQEEHYYLRRSPVLCGLMVFRFSLTLNELGLMNSNQWGATIAVAHIYNAMRHELPSFPRWLDMEALILTHSVQRIFWRDHLPSNAGQYSRSYERATGTSDMLAQRNNSRGSVIVPKKAEERGIGPVSLVSQQYWRRFCFKNKYAIKTLPDVEAVLNQAAGNVIEEALSGWRHVLLEAVGIEYPSEPADNAAMETASQQALTAQFQSTRVLTNIQLLSALCTRIGQETYSLNFDYFSFHTRCMRVLKAIYKEFKSEIVESCGKLYWGRGELPVISHYIFKWMEEDENKKARILERLASVMEPIVGSEGATQVTELIGLFRNGGRVMDDSEDWSDEEVD